MVIDLACGPVQNIEIEPKVGQVIRLPYAQYQMLEVASTSLAEARIETESKEAVVSLRFYPVKEESGSTFVFCGIPQAWDLPFEREYVARDGHLGIARSEQSNASHIVDRVSLNLKDIALVRAKYYPNARRLIFHLPELPGLPEENRHVDNLFAVKIPYVRLETSWDFVRCIQDATQLNFTFSGPAPVTMFPPGYFPHSFENVTPEELLAEYLKYKYPNRVVRVDAKNNTLTFADPTLKSWKEKVQSLLGRFF